VRPLTNEEDLQNLDKMEFDELRPEFFEQVISLRKRVLGRVKPKMVGGKALNGNMFSSLLQSYVGAINNGAVPNIESAWSYVCKNECMKASTEALDSYENNIREILHGKIPCEAEELALYHKIAKESSLAIFKKKAFGEVSSEYLKEFKQRIQQTHLQIRQENEKESRRMCQMFIQQEFSTIDRKLKTGEYRSFFDFEHEVKLFYTYFMENAPNTVNKELIILQFLNRVLGEGGGVFARQQSEETKL